MSTTMDFIKQKSTTMWIDDAVTAWTRRGSTPIADIRTLLRELKKTTGKRGNTAAMGEAAWKIARKHKDFKDRCRHVDIPKNPAARVEMFCAVVGIDRLFVGWENVGKNAFCCWVGLPKIKGVTA